MKLRPSRLRKLVRQGGFPTVLKINLSDPRVIEMAGLAGVDAVWLCNEHVPNDWLSLENQIRAARVHDIDSLVRVSRGSYSDYIKPFEADATGIIVPHVANLNEARQIVEWVRFQPMGKRPFDGGNTDGQFCLVPLEQYMEHSNRERLVILQIESPEALEEVELIAAVSRHRRITVRARRFQPIASEKSASSTRRRFVAAPQNASPLAAHTHRKFLMTAGLIAPFPDLASEGHQVIGIGADVEAVTSYVAQRLSVVQGHINALPTKGQSIARSTYV